MDKKVLIRLLNHRIEEIETSINSFSKPGSVHDIELDMLLSKIRFFYSEVKLLSQIEEEAEKPEEIQSAPATPEHQGDLDPQVDLEPPALTDPLTNTEPGNEEISEEADSIIEPQATPEPDDFEEVLIETGSTLPSDNPVPEESESAPEPEDTPDLLPIVEPSPAPKVPQPIEPEEISIAPPPPEKKQQLSFQDKSNGKLLTGVKMQAVDDIMVAIGLNDRFLFTRELFNNDAELFTKTIGVLNQKESWENAAAFLNDNFSWDYEDPTWILFLSFVKRRFI